MMEKRNGGQMNSINLNNQQLEIKSDDFIDVCENFKKRIFKILYLKEDMLAGRISEYDVKSYINSLTWDLYGVYTVFGNYKFLNAICELEGIKENLIDDFVRKKVLDLASFIASIPFKKE
jgi:two-component sensor histidine kinase